MWHLIKGTLATSVLSPKADIKEQANLFLQHILYH
jgi:hypothetical protein